MSAMDYFANHCRLCKTSSPLAHSWSNVLSADNKHLLFKIQTCTNVQIHENDKLPKRICDVCQINLNQAHSFRLQCEQANGRLQFELDFLEKNDWDTSLPIPAMEHEATTDTNSVNKGNPELATVYIKPELKDDSEPEDKHFSAYVELNVKQDDDDTDNIDRSSPISETKTGDNKKSRRSKNASKGHQCNVCSRTFRRKCLLREHAARHTGVRSVECAKCDKKFFSETDLKTHLKRIHAEKLPYECEKCYREFASKGQLTNHLTTHLESRDFPCDVCSKEFKTKHLLKVHMETHLPKELQKVKKKQNNYKECVCPFCGKLSTCVATHTKHLRTHTGEQPYECHICNKRFTTSCSRNNHLRIHSDERPFQCQHCQKAFRERQHLAVHVRSAHTGERPYQCKYCDRTFVTRGNMRLHERVHGDPATSGSAVAI